MLARASGSGCATWLARCAPPALCFALPKQLRQRRRSLWRRGQPWQVPLGKSAWQRPRPPRRRRQRRALAGGFGPRLWVGALGSVRVDIDSIPPGIAHNRDNNFNFDIGRSSIHGLNKNSLPGANNKQYVESAF